jgi:hypothetical protein
VSLDATFRPLATRLLRDLSGLLVTYKRVTEGAYNPETGASTPTEASSSVYAYAAAPNALQLQAGVVEEGDILLYISAAELGFKPKPGDKVTYESADWTITAVEFFSSGTLDALYTVTVRRV